MTIPILLQNKEKQETITGLKAANSILANAVNMAQVNHGDVSEWDYTLGSAAFAKQYITPYLNVSKVCGTTTGGPETATGCFGGEGGNWYDMNGNVFSTGGGYSRPWYYTFVLQNGMGVGVWRNVPGNNYAVFVVDINGTKGPTRAGKDIFYFSVDRRGLTLGIRGAYMAMEGINQNKYTRDQLLGKSVSGGCNVAAPQNAPAYTGSACGVVILKDGWEIKDDYPW